MTREYGLSPYDAAVITEERETAAYYEAASAGRDRKLVANWMTVELFGALNKSGQSLDACQVAPEALGGLVGLIEDGTISGKIAKDVFAEMFETGRDAAAIVAENGLKQVSDSVAIESMIDVVRKLAENPTLASFVVVHGAVPEMLDRFSTNTHPILVASTCSADAFRAATTLANEEARSQAASCKLLAVSCKLQVTVACTTSDF